MAEQKEDASKVFISYSRKNKVFVKKLNEALDAAGVSTWVDWEGIPLSADWMAEITAAIEGADAFLFIITPDSLASKVCMEELGLGIRYNKKFVPILHLDPPKGTEMPEALAKTNWVYLRPQKDKFSATIPKLIEAINTDLDWVRQHTRILQRAQEWDTKTRNNSFLLQGADLEDGERWMTESTAKPNRQIVPVQAEYISTSRKVSVQRQRNLMIGIFIALIVSVFLGIFALLQRNIARKNEMIAKAQRSVADAQLYQDRSGELNTSTLLAVDGWHLAESSQAPDIQSQAENILRNNITLLPVPVAQMSHNGAIWKINPNTDGSRFVSASEDKTACVWKTASGEKQYCVHHDLSINDALFSVDDKYLITASDDGTVRIWDAANGKEIKRFEYGTSVWDLSVSRNGQWLAIGRADSYATIIDLANLDKAPINMKQNGEVYSVVFSPDNNWLAIGTISGYTTFRSMTSDHFLDGPKHADSVFNFAFSPDGKWAVSAGADSTARVTNLITGEETYVLQHGSWVEDVAFSPDGTWFAAASDDNWVYVWDIATGTNINSMEHKGFVQRVAISPDGHWIASTGYDRTARIWDAVSGSQLKEVPLKGIGSGLLFSPDGKLLTVSDRDGNISTWDISPLSARVGYLEFPEDVREVRFDESGKWLAADTADYKVWKMDTAQMLNTNSGVEGEAIISSNDLTNSMAISPNSKWIAVAEKTKKQVLLHKMEDKTNWILKLDAVSNSIAFSPDNQLIAAGTENSKIVVWSVETGTKSFELQDDAPIHSVQFSPNGQWLMAGTSDQITVWDITQRAKIATALQAGDINALAFNQDGSLLATASSNGSVYIWDTKAATYNSPLHKFKINGKALMVNFSSNGRWLAIGSSAQLAYLWDLTTAQEVARIPHVDEVTSVSFSMDGKILATVSRKVVELWDAAAIPLVDSKDLITISCGRLTSNLSEATWKLLFLEEEYRMICPELPVGTN
jgi:WD40 repeat protein